MKKIFTLFISLFLVIGLFARPVDKSEALTIAKSFFSTSASSAMRASSNVSYNLVYTRSSDENSTSSQNYFYVYNIGSNNGFVIISADSRTKSVLAYSQTGHFNANSIPDNLKVWLDYYTSQIEYAIKNVSETDDTSTESSISKVKMKSPSSVIVQPLLGTVAFDQDVPYNDSCPSYLSTKTVTGCVATAMVQIMKYYEWPTQGTGSHSYTSSTRSFTLSANFGATTYDWSNMLNMYSGSETTAQKAAIAQLMFHAGVSVDMDYDIASNGGSAAYSEDAGRSFYNYFGYDAGVQIYYKSFYSAADWESKIKTELNAGRPILYSGSNDNAGHAFVCDGYDDNDMFHINWGWSGYSNGYFELSALNPTDQGIGSSNGGYNQSQSIITGIQEPVSGSIHSVVMKINTLTTSATTIAKTSTVNLTSTYVVNYGLFTGDVDIKFGLFQNNALVYTFNGWTYSSLPRGSGWSSYTKTNISFNNYATGSYQLKILYKDGNGEYVPLGCATGGNNSIDVTITDTQVIFSPVTITPSLALTASPTTSSNLYQNRNGEFSLSIQNSGTGDYYAQIGVELVKTDNSSVTQQVVNSITQISTGETKTISLAGDITVAPGTYYVYVYYDAANSQTTTSFPTTLMGPSMYIPTVTVNAEPTTSPALSIVGTPTMPSSVAQGEPFTLNASIQNTGGLFDGDLLAAVFLSSGGSSITTFGYQSAIIDYNVTKSSDFDGSLYLDAGSYKTAIYYYDTSWHQLSNTINFSITEPVATAVDITKQNGEFRIVNNPVANELKVILPNDGETLALFDIQGRLLQILNVKGKSDASMTVNNLASGTYILMLQTSIDRKAIKVLKR